MQFECIPIGRIIFLFSFPPTSQVKYSQQKWMGTCLPVQWFYAVNTAVVRTGTFHDAFEVMFPVPLPTLCSQSNKSSNTLIVKYRSHFSCASEVRNLRWYPNTRFFVNITNFTFAVCLVTMAPLGYAAVEVHVI